MRRAVPWFPTARAHNARLTTAVVSDIAEPELNVLVAVTRTLTFDPTSLPVKTYVLLVAPAMLVQLPPDLPQRSHW